MPEKKICPICNREVDARGMSGHMKTHKKEVKEEDDGVISYPSNKVEEKDNPDIKDSDIEAQTEKLVKKPVKKPAASSPASSPASNPAHNPTSNSRGKDTRGEQKPEKHMIEEYKGLFR